LQLQQRREARARAANGDGFKGRGIWWGWDARERGGLGEGEREGLGEGLGEGQRAILSDVRAAIGYIWLHNLNFMHCMSLSCHEKVQYSPRGAPVETPLRGPHLAYSGVFWAISNSRTRVFWPFKKSRIWPLPVQPC
jgi:hypothetical protein